MPELPEVQTTASGLDRFVRGLSVTDVWTDYNSPYYIGSDNIKDPKYFSYFKKIAKRKTITSVSRRAKNVLIHLSDNFTIIVHMKMTGHLLYGGYDRSDPYNRFIHFILYLSNGKNIELSDARKFAKVAIVPTETLHLSSHLKDIGPEPLEKEFTYEKFVEQIAPKKEKRIKPTLTDQTVIAGIGNIYADESLWRAGIHPEETVKKIPMEKMKKLFMAIKETLAKGIDFGGDSMSDYRNIHGKRGKFQELHHAYKRTGKKCSRRGCRGFIIRTVVAGRGTHFCDMHQELSKNSK
ncbi:MAG: DNA-formamidopyrimidine glycosylase [bacterium]|nr:DNA-formamidopyrimidine glycosylase [bacterium]